MSGSPPPISPVDKALLEEIQGSSNFRRTTGIILTGLGIADVGAVLYSASHNLPDLAKTTTDSTIAIALLSAHGVLGVAAIFFGYQLLKMAERLFVPKFVLEGKDVEVIRALTGVDHPTKFALDHVKNLVELLKAVKETKP
jgi:hypothetical protein